MSEMEGRKDDSGKERFDLIKTTTLRGVAKVLTFGAKKYAPDNWKKVPDAQDRYYAAALRHLIAFRDGELVDPETGLNHLWHAICCLMFLDNLPKLRTYDAGNVKVLVNGKEFKIEDLPEGGAPQEICGYSANGHICGLRAGHLKGDRCCFHAQKVQGPTGTHPSGWYTFSGDGSQGYPNGYNGSGAKNEHGGRLGNNDLSAWIPK